MSNRARVIASVLLAAALAAAFGFVVHVFTVEVVERYVSTMMAGRHVAPSWDVRIPAALSSIEQGLALAALYLLLRAALPSLSTLLRGMLAGAFVLALNGSLIRQPMMNLLVGNPINVVAVQDGLTWLIWLGMGIITAVCLDLAIPATARK